MEVLSKSNRRKIVGASCVYNEEDIIEYWLEQLADVVDEIVIVDDGSKDRTVEILRKHPKVKEIHIQPPMKETGYAPREHINRNIMMNLARKRGADWIIYLDADEIFSYNIRDFIDELVQAPDDIVEYRFTKIWLWRSEHLYRVDRPEKFLKPAEWRFFRNIPSLKWVSEAQTSGTIKYIVKRVLGLIGSEKIFSGAAVLRGLYGKSKFIENVYVLHYACANMEREVKKRIKYAIGRRFLYKKKTLDQICDEVYSVIDEKGLKLKAVDPDWFPLYKRTEIKKLIDDRFFPMICFSKNFREIPQIEWI